MPSLVRMALDPWQASRHRIVSLLISVAIGLVSNYLPSRYDPEEDRAHLARVRGWASAFALAQFGITDQAVTDALTETVARPPAASETMSFLSGSYRRLAELALYEITRSPAPR